MSEDRKLQEPEALGGVSYAAMPTYGNVPWADLIAAVNIAQTGSPDVPFKTDPSYFIGHHPVSMNMNSLNRIVSMFVALSTPPAPEAASVVPEGWKLKRGADGDSIVIVNRHGVESPAFERRASWDGSAERWAWCLLEDLLDSPPLTAPAAPEAVGEATDEQIIARCEAAGMKWLPPFDNQPEDGDFKGAFDLSDIASLRKLLAATPLKQEGAEPDPNAPKEIWLQLYGDSSADEGPVDYTHDVSWCWHQVFESDVRYVQATAQEPAPQGDKRDAERYRLLRRGQHWSVIDGIGEMLRAERLDAAVDAARSGAKP